MPPENFEWIFFSSKNGVKHFFSREKPQIDKKYAAIGPATAEEIKKYIPIVHFIGEGNDTAGIANTFAVQVAAGEKVLFPQALYGKRAVQNALGPKQSLGVAVYETIPTEKSLTAFYKAILFTSPSNVEGFLLANTILPEQICVAIGLTTANALQERGFQCEIAQGFTIEDIAETIFGLLS